MEYIYAAMLLHQTGKPVDETNINKVLETTGVSPDPAKTKALVASLEGVDIEQAIKEAATMQAAPAATSAEAPKEEKKPEVSEEEKKKKEEQATAGLGALFG